MFNNFTGLFGRNFLAAYFLPAMLFLLANLSVLKEVGYLTIITINLKDQIDIIAGTFIFSLISWLIGIVLLVTNKDIVSVIEGYGRFNPLKVFHKLQKIRYRRIKKAISILDQEYLSCINEKREFNSKNNNKRNTLMQKLVEFFPDDEQWLLPTSLGNIIRAFEVYSRVMYGFDSIKGWERLLAVIPTDYRNIIDTAKSDFDFWINVFFLSLVFLLEYLLIVLNAYQIKLMWVPISTTVIIILSYARAKRSSIEWGDLVKSSFDIFLFELAKKLGFATSLNRDEEKALWTKFSQSIIYFDFESMPNREEIEKEQLEKVKKLYLP